MLKIIRTQTKKEDLGHSLLSIGFYAAGSLMPVWLSSVLLILFNQPVGIGTFVDNGEFAIYAAAALSPIIFLLFKQTSGLEKALYLLLVLLALIIAAGIFSGLTVVDTLPLGQFPINTPFLRWWSITIYIIALVATFFVDLHENVYNSLNMEQERLDRQTELETEFDEVLSSFLDTNG